MSISRIVFTAENRMKSKKKHVAVLFFAAILTLMVSSITTFAEIRLRSPRVDADLATWDCVYFGNYNNEPIKWRVLNVYDDGNALLLSEAILDEMPFSIEGTPYYKDSFIRTWFKVLKNKAFSDNEKNSLARTIVEPGVEDDFYLMSNEELNRPQYGFINNGARAAGSSWWTRTRFGTQGADIYTVRNDGELKSSASSSTSYSGVRPALKINTTLNAWTYAGCVDSNGNSYMPIEYVTVTVSPLSAAYTGAPITPSVELKIGDTVLSEENYEVSYQDNTNVGTAVVAITGKQHVSGNKNVQFEIQPASMDDVDVVLSPSTASYTGSAITPSVEVKIGDTVISKDNYDVSYQDNTNIGTAAVTVTGKNNLSGNKTVTFDIQPISIETAEVTLSVSTAAYTGSPITPAVTVKVGDKVLTADDYDVSYQNNTNVGTASVTITGKGQFSGTKTVKFMITEAPVLPLLIASGKPQGNSAVKLSWNVISGAKEYTVYCAKSGSRKWKAVGTTNGNTFKVKKLNKSKVYQFYVSADVSGNTISSPTIAAAMPKAKKANATGIKVTTSGLVLDQNQTAKIKASVLKKGKKALVKIDAPIRYYSSNESVATVNNKGNVTARGTGSCTIYAVAANGLSRTIRVAVVA